MIKIFEGSNENPRIRNNKEVQSPQRLENNSTITVNTENKVSLLINKFENKKELKITVPREKVERTAKFSDLNAMHEAKIQNEMKYMPP